MFTLNIEDSKFSTNCFVEKFIEKNNSKRFCYSLSNIFFQEILEDVLDNKTAWIISTQTLFYIKKDAVIWIKKFLKNLDFKIIFDDKTSDFLENKNSKNFLWLIDKTDKETNKYNNYNNYNDYNSYKDYNNHEKKEYEKQKNNLHKKLLLLKNGNNNISFSSENKRKENQRFYCKKNKEIFIEKLSNCFSGITVIPDIHGDEEKFFKAVKWSIENNSFMIFLGDIFGQKSNANFFTKENFNILDLLYDILKNNQGVFIIGNHDIRMQKFLNSYHRSNLVCPSSLRKDHKIAELELKKILFIFKYYYCFANALPYCWFKDDDQKFFFSHALFNQKIFDVENEYEKRKLENEFIFGNYIFIDNRFVDDLSWIKNIEKNATCFVGHTVTNFNMPNTLYNENGGKICFLDLGCGKKGNLCVADLVFYKEKQDQKIHTKLRNYKII